MAQRDVSAEELARAKGESAHWIAHAGCLWARVLADGRCIYLAPLPRIPGKVTLGISRNIFVHAYYRVWEYDSDDSAWVAAIGWDGHGDPKGYTRPILTPEAPP